MRPDVGNKKRKPRSTTPIDAWVGGKIRMRRHTIGMTQGALAAALGITFQQVQKYENGTNRVGAGRLEHIARVLGMPVAWFFEDASKAASGQTTGSMSDLTRFLQSRYAPQVVRSFVRLPDSLQKNFVRLLVQVAGTRP